MPDNDKPLDLDPNSLHFIPLGGSEEFGVNLNVYALKNKWLAIDCGIGFAGHRYPGIDILLPDPKFLEDRMKDLVGLIVTHAHEDHIGAVPYLWKRLNCPIYCSPFTAEIMKQKMNDISGNERAKIIVVKAGDTVDMGPFKVSFAHVSHSIPDALSAFIQTDAGNIVHSGDWNLDPNPVLGDLTDKESFKAFGDKGVLAYVGDSTNAEVPGRTGSETEVEKGLAALFPEIKGRIAITLFASNIGRVRSICRAAKSTGRKVVLMGRSLHRMVGAAVQCGYLRDIPEFYDMEDIDSIPDGQIVMLVTGSQGETNAMLSRISRGEHPSVSLRRGDTVIFSARPIPGNEEEINAVKNNLAATGVNVIGTGDTDHKIHISGHPCQDEILDMFQWVRPKIVIPVHGERSQLEAHARLARKSQIGSVVVPNNGSVIRITQKGAEIIDHVPTGLLAVEPNRILPAGHQAINARRKLQFTGTVHITLVMDDRGELVDDPKISTMGLIDPDDPEESGFEEDIALEVEDALADMDSRRLGSDDDVAEQARIATRRLVSSVLGMKPKTSVHIVRV
jgi:ribonuclease J